MVETESSFAPEIDIYPCPNLKTAGYLLSNKKPSIIFSDADNCLCLFGNLHPFEQVTSDTTQFLKQIMPKHQLAIVSLQPDTNHWIANCLDRHGRPTLPAFCQRQDIPLIRKPALDFLHPFRLSKTDSNILTPTLDFCDRFPDHPVYVLGDRQDDVAFAQALQTRLSVSVTMLKFPSYSERFKNILSHTRPLLPRHL